MEITDSVGDDDDELSTSGSTTAATATATAAATSSTPAAAAVSNLDEDLREASALGDIERVASLLSVGANINSANRVNGWTALHWSAKRGHAQVVGLLLGRGANPEVLNAAGQTPADVASCDKLSRMLGGSGRGRRLTTSPPPPPPSAARGASTNGSASTSGFVPNYLRNPEFPYVRRQAAEEPSRNRSFNGGADRRKEELLLDQQRQQHQRKQSLPQRQQQEGDSSTTVQQKQQSSSSSELPHNECPLLLQVRISESDDPDFIEVELTHLSYEELLDLVCQEMSLDPSSVERIRKLPNVRLRNDRDVARLEHGQQLEIVLRDY